MQPSELLSAAADRVRDLAAQATPGPWCGPTVTANWSADSVTAANGRVVACHCGDDTRWIAALSPAVAEPLIDWLQATAKAVFVWEELDRPFNAAELAAVRFAAVVCPDLAGETP